jgi:hypothetical protein
MLEPAQRLMEDHNVSMAGVMHLNKDLMKDLLSRVTASGAFTAIVRIAPSLGFRIIECSVTSEDEDVPTSRVAILGDSEVTAEQLVKGRGSPGTKTAQAERLLRRLCPVHKDTNPGGRRFGHLHCHARTRVPFPRRETQRAGTGPNDRPVGLGDVASAEVAAVHVDDEQR